jgi:hypothetical protein
MKNQNSWWHQISATDAAPAKHAVPQAKSKQSKFLEA